MPTGKKAMRMCCGCGEMFPKSELMRVVRTPDGSALLDLSGKKNGRGAYLCKNVDCFRKARRSNRIARTLSCEITDSIYEVMENEIPQSN